MAIRPIRFTAWGAIGVWIFVFGILMVFGLGIFHIMGETVAPIFGPSETQSINMTTDPFEEVVLARPMPRWNGRTRLIARTPNDETLEFPMLKSEYRVDIRGDMATVRVRQTFKNPRGEPVAAKYEFPLHEKSAIYAMTMRSGDQRIRAQIERKEEAKEIFEQAEREGKTAALLEQDRPNIFTQSIANLMPGSSVEVELHYVQPLPKTDGRYQLDLPLVVGPRYEPSDMSKNYLVADPAGGSDAAEHQGAKPPHFMEAALPKTLDSERVSIEVRIDGGVPVKAIESDTHQLLRTQLAPNIWELKLDEGREMPNKHFSLTYKLGGEQTSAGVVSYYDKDAKKGYFGLLIEPPTELKADAEEIVPREMVFVIDASGSMSGAPMEANKAYMRHTLQNLRPSDTFRLIEFSQQAREYWDAPTRATPKNIAEALAYVEGLEADGGSNINGAIDQALSPKVAPGHLRLVTFLTDGYVSNEFEILRTLNEKLGDARLFGVGVGATVNRYLLSEMGRMGNGFSKIIDPSEDVRPQAFAIAERLQSPVLRDIRVDWGEFASTGSSASQVPDLFAGESVRLLGTFKKPGSYRVVVHGTSGRGPVSFPLEFTVSEHAAEGRAVELSWARSMIRDYMQDLLTPEDQREGDLSDTQIKKLITSMGLEHELVTQWTSFVAVSEEIVNPVAGANEAWRTASEALDSSAPGDDISPRAAAYPQQQHHYAPSASGTPEPATWAGLLLAALAVIFAMWGPRRRERPMA